MATFFTIVSTGALIGSIALWRKRQQAAANETTDSQLAQPITNAVEPPQTAASSTPIWTDKFTLDRLELINGLTPHHARLFNAAGLFTYHDLSQISAENIVSITAEAGGARMDVNRWIAQARQLAADNPLPTNGDDPV
ncbi:MAG: hypothetical protein ACPG8W_13210 [Candidatus Promineifilaceae bacterium]